MNRFLICCLLLCSMIMLGIPVVATESEPDVNTLQAQLEECVNDESLSNQNKATQLFDLFSKYPRLFISAAAQTTKEVNDWIANRFAREIYFGRDQQQKEKFPEVVYAMDIWDFDTLEEKDVYKALRGAVWEHWGVVKYESIDWDQVDWTYDSAVDYFNTPYWPSLHTWLVEQDDYSLVFRVTAKGDGAWSDTKGCVLFEKLVADPYGLIQALALEDAAMQEGVMHSIVYYGSWYSAFGQFLGNIRLPQSATPTEKAILAEIIRIARDVFYIEVPNTGDPIAMPAALLLLSAAGIVCLTKRKKSA
ncbi:MAG: hypothetical protein IJ448_05905 [Oscillospiraceae bacterium]|nr:hypothetical protein [Oscillospiraceae bacterium]